MTAWLAPKPECSSNGSVALPAARQIRTALNDETLEKESTVTCDGVEAE
jgi:hypothetical protein